MGTQRFIASRSEVHVKLRAPNWCLRLRVGWGNGLVGLSP